MNGSFAPRHAATVASLAVLALLCAGPAAASFFQVAESCPSGLGNAFAGGAAVAEDACTVWYNPAGMTRLDDTQVVLGVNFIMPSIDFTDGGSRTFTGQPLSGGDGGDFGEDKLVPNLYVTHQINDRLVIGLGLNAPFGLTTDYDDNWIGRYHADRSDIFSLNVNPSIAYKINEFFSIGAGVNVQYIDAELSQAIDFGSTCLALQLSGQLPPGTCAAFGQAPQQTDGKGVVTADDTSFGFNLGLLWQPSDNARLGLAYRSAISYDLEGDFDVTFPNAQTAAFAGLIGVGDAGASAEVDLPGTISLSFYWQAPSRKWAWMADVTQTDWSQIPELRIDFDNTAPDSVITLGLDDSYRYAVGTTLMPSEHWAVRFGVALDETPVPSPELRTPRLPDEERTWYTAGLEFKKSDRFSFSASYAHIEVDEALVNKRATPGSEDFLRGNLIGVYDFGVDIVSAQISWHF